MTPTSSKPSKPSPQGNNRTVTVIEALRSEFGDDALKIARQMLAKSRPAARAGWENIIAIMERDGPSA